MGEIQQNFAIDAANSALNWWRDAGVDVVVGETPHDWLDVIAKTKTVEQPVVSQVVTLPTTHAGLIDWLKTGEIAEAGPPRRRLAPAGDPTSGLMILADFPESADIDSGTHMSGPLADLFDKMLTALGRDRSTIYVATLCPGRPLSGRLPDQCLTELAALARHHIALVAPKQLWLMGGAASRAILGIDDAAAKGKLHFVNLDGLIVNTIATAHPRFFEGSKARKAAAWAEMQRLMIRDDA
jgi:uracil-DNA glycosylase